MVHYRLTALAASIAIAWIIAPLPAASQETCGVAVTACRDALFVTQDIVVADDACANAVSANALDGCARIFRAVTRVLRVFGEDTDGSDPKLFTDSVKEMLDQFGVGAFERDVYNFSPSLPKNITGEIDFPADSPDGSDVQDALDLLVVTALQDSAADLQTVSDSTVVQLTNAELQTIAGSIRASILEPNIEFDYGDSKVLEFLFLLWESQLLFLIALDLDIDIDSYTPVVNKILVQADVIDPNPNLARLQSGASSALADANQANRDAFAAYLAASTFIRGEVDDQTDDLFTIEPAELDDEAEVRIQLATLVGSLDAPTSILNTGTTLIEEAKILDALNTKLGTNFNSQGAILDLGLFYDQAPFDVRNVLPTFDAGNSVPDASFPDPTFGVVLLPEPDFIAGQLASVALLSLLFRWRSRREF